MSSMMFSEIMSSPSRKPCLKHAISNDYSIDHFGTYLIVIQTGNYFETPIPCIICQHDNIAFLNLALVIAAETRLVHCTYLPTSAPAFRPSVEVDFSKLYGQVLSLVLSI